MISLLTFIQTGRLGDIGVGSTRTEVELAFGPPDEKDERPPKRGIFFDVWEWVCCLNTPEHFSTMLSWSYGQTRFYFREERVVNINVDLPNYGRIGTCEFDLNGLNENSTLAQVKEWLKEAGISHEQEATDAPGHYYFETDEPKIYFDFLGVNGVPTLESVSI